MNSYFWYNFNIKLINIWIWAPLGPFGTLGPYLFSYLGPLWALLGPLALCDYERLWNSVLFWKGRKLSGKAGSFLEKAGSFLERQEAFWKKQAYKFGGNYCSGFLTCPLKLRQTEAHHPTPNTFFKKVLI